MSTLSDLGTELCYAAIAGDIDTAIALLDRGAHPDAADNFGFTPLMMAAKCGHVDVVKLLLERGAVAGSTNSFGMSALKWPVLRGNLEIVVLLLQAGANPNECYKGGAWLDWAVQSRASDKISSQIVRTLLLSGADPNATIVRGLEVLAAAALMGKVEVARELISGGARFRNHRQFEVALTLYGATRNMELRRLLESIEPGRWGSPV